MRIRASYVFTLVLLALIHATALAEPNIPTQSLAQTTQVPVLIDDLDELTVLHKPSTRSPSRVYLQTCAYCHDHNIAPVITGRNLPIELLRYVIRNGVNAMPAFRPTDISEAELQAVAIWIAESQPEKENKHE